MTTTTTEAAGDTPGQPINTRKAGRRALRFETIDDVLAEIDRIEAADRAGTLRTTGNWTVGQTFGHLAAWINYGYEGFPAGAHPPWFVRVILRRFVMPRALRRGVSPGMRIPRVDGGTFGIEPLSTEEGARRLREALARLKNREPVRYHSPAFGPMDDEQRIAFQLRHAELHLGFLWT